MEMGGTHGYLICFDCVKDHKQGMAVERGDLDRQYIVGEQGRNRKSEANAQTFCFNLWVSLRDNVQKVPPPPGLR